MKFWIGFTLGAAVAATVVNQMNEEQRATLSRKARSVATSGRTGDVASTIRGGVGSIADEATARVTDAVDSASTTVADAISTDEPSTTP